MPEDRRGLVAELLDGQHSGLTSREAALVGFTKRLSEEPSEIRHGDVDTLRAAGLDDREIHDAVQVAAYFAYANRIALGLGIAIESDQDSHGQWPDTD